MPRSASIVELSTVMQCLPTLTTMMWSTLANGDKPHVPARPPITAQMAAECPMMRAVHRDSSQLSIERHATV